MVYAVGIYICDIRREDGEGCRNIFDFIDFSVSIVTLSSLRPRKLQEKKNGN
jgi:hypothetical protein